MTCRTSGSAQDILSRPWLAFLLFWLPAIAIAVTGGSHFHGIVRAAVWAASLSVMGVACIVNAARCHRVHCYLTGPFFLAMAVVTLLYGFGILTLGRNGWTVLALAIVIGAFALCCLPEWVFGKYRKHPTMESKRCGQSDHRT
jgi:hypothetical protein